MPYQSDAQKRFFHSPGAKKKGITSDKVEEYDEASRGMTLPERKEKDPLEKALGYKKK